MKLKQEESKTYQIFRRVVSNKRTKLIFISLFIMVIFLTGVFSGLLIIGFFGSFDNPSQRTIEIMHWLGIYNLRIFKVKLESAMHENIKIPFNYVKGQFSSPEKIFIDINFKDYQKIKFKREQALEMQRLITSPDDYVPAKIRYKDKEADVKLRLKGDMPDHFEGDKWSFRIKVRGDETIEGMKVFSIQDPATKGYLSEWFYHKVLKEEDVLSIRYEFVEVIINGENKGIYALEEHFDKRLVEYNNRREGVIVKFGTDFNDQDAYKIKENLDNIGLWVLTLDEHLLADWFQATNIEVFRNKDLEDPVLFKQFTEARYLLESFKTGSLKTHEVFDVDKLATYFAINTLLFSHHAPMPDNIRFYYNPITSKLEPIGFDATLAMRESVDEIIALYQPSYLPEDNDLKLGSLSYFDLFFTDRIFYERYRQELRRVSQPDYIHGLLVKFEDEIEKNINIIHKDTPTYSFLTENFYKYQGQIADSYSNLTDLNSTGSLVGGKK